MLLPSKLEFAMQERGSGQGRAHIPFRNSMLTTALRDSLGGNCRTVMVANVAATSDQAEETISTCRFAQRVAMISNSVSILSSHDNQADAHADWESLHMQYPPSAPQ